MDPVTNKADSAPETPSQPVELQSCLEGYVRQALGMPDKRQAVVALMTQQLLARAHQFDQHLSAAAAQLPPGLESVEQLRTAYNLIMAQTRQAERFLRFGFDLERIATHKPG